MYCMNCGQKLPDTARFCPECGEKTKLAQSPSPSESKTDPDVSTTTPHPEAPLPVEEVKPSTPSVTSPPLEEPAEGPSLLLIPSLPSRLDAPEAAPSPESVPNPVEEVQPETESETVVIDSQPDSEEAETKDEVEEKPAEAPVESKPPRTIAEVFAAPAVTPLSTPPSEPPSLTPPEKEEASVEEAVEPSSEPPLEAPSEDGSEGAGALPTEGTQEGGQEGPLEAPLETPLQAPPKGTPEGAENVGEGMKQKPSANSNSSPASSAAPTSLSSMTRISRASATATGHSQRSQGADAQEKPNITLKPAVKQFDPPPTIASGVKGSFGLGLPLLLFLVLTPFILIWSSSFTSVFLLSPIALFVLFVTDIFLLHYRRIRRAFLALGVVFTVNGAISLLLSYFSGGLHGLLNKTGWALFTESMAMFADVAAFTALLSCLVGIVMLSVYCCIRAILGIDYKQNKCWGVGYRTFVQIFNIVLAIFAVCYPLIYILSSYNA